MDPLIFLMRAQRQGLVWSIDGASCGAAGQNRLPLRRALWAYRSLGWGSRRLIHMKCGAMPALLLLFHRSSSKRKRCISPINRASAEAGRETRPRSDARRIFHSAAGCYQATTQSDETGGRGVPAAFWLLCRRGQSNPRRSAEYPEKTLIHRLDAIKPPPSPIRQRDP